MRLIVIFCLSFFLASTVQAANITNLKKTSCGEYEDKTVKRHSMNTPFSREFKKLRKGMNKATNNGFNRFLMPTQNNVRAENSVTLEKFKAKIPFVCASVPAMWAGRVTGAVLVSQVTRNDFSFLKMMVVSKRANRCGTASASISQRIISRMVTPCLFSTLSRLRIAQILKHLLCL